jgi:carboxyl-terminal processing protease
MRGIERLTKLLILFSAFGLSTYFALQFRSGGLWHGIEPAHAVAARGGLDTKTPYDLTKLEAVTATIQTIRDKYVDPNRVKPKQMLLSALDFVQRDVAQVIVLRDSGVDEVTVRVGSEEKKFDVSSVQGPWDVSAKLRDIFAFLQENLKNDPEVDLREVEYAACNGMLNTLDPHSVFLSPEAYKEMTISTQGAFGGVGIVISIRDQLLTVIRPMPGTPAGRMGLKRYDRILRINNEPTLNMPLDDAVRRLRGDPGTDVTVWVSRDGAGGWTGSRPFKLRREIINVESVESRMLDQGVGYVRIKQFQAGTAGELDSALVALHRAEPRLRGLVLDMRSNPGGLLDQAAKVADRFLRGGVVVTTVSASEPRDEKVAKSPGTEPDYPLVVLVNSSSASASEIVAGALKGHNRAVIVGQNTFGKGSVQLVFPDVTREKAALKLTIAQYLTPGDISIQSVGITPDIELDPMTVDRLEMDVMRPGKRMRERDLSKHLSSARAAAGQKPLEVVRYNLPVAEREAMRERGGDPEDDFEMDFPTKFSRDLVLNLPAGVPRVDAVRRANEFIERVQNEEMGKVASDLKALGYDWSTTDSGTPGPTKDQFEVKVETNRPGERVKAGESMELKVTVKNNGTEPVYQLRGLTAADSSYYDRKEFIFGKIEPGKSKTAIAPLGWCDVEGRRIGSTKRLKDAKRVCTIPKDAPTRADGIKVEFFSANGEPPKTVDIRPTIEELPDPSFAYAYQIIDNREGANGDGRIQRGEGVSMYLTVKNIGKGRSFETQANLRNLSGDGLALQAGRFDISNMQPGDMRSVLFTWAVRDLTESEITIELSVTDRDLGKFASEKIKIPVEPVAPLTPDSGVAKVVANEAPLVESLRPNARLFGSLPPGTVVRKLGRHDNMVKIDLGANRFAFVPLASLGDAAGAPAPDAISFDTVFSHAPPAIELAPSALVVRGSTVKVTGTIVDQTRLLDAYMFVGANKIFYRSNQAADDPKKMNVDIDVPVRPGMNAITLVGRQNADTVSRRTIMVRRDGASGELLPTPKDDGGVLLDFVEDGP